MTKIYNKNVGYQLYEEAWQQYQRAKSVADKKVTKAKKDLIKLSRKEYLPFLDQESFNHALENFKLSLKYTRHNMRIKETLRIMGIINSILFRNEEALDLFTEELKYQPDDWISKTFINKILDELEGCCLKCGTPVNQGKICENCGTERKEYERPVLGDFIEIYQKADNLMKQYGVKQRIFSDTVKRLKKTHYNLLCNSFGILWNYRANEREIVQEHIKQYFGKLSNAFSLWIDKLRGKLETLVFPPTTKHNYGLNITLGLSEFTIHKSPNLKWVELFIKVPPSWPAPQIAPFSIKDLLKDEHQWVLGNLIILARSIITREHHTFPEHGQVIDNHNYSNTKLRGFLLIYPPFRVPREFKALKVSPSKTIHFIQLLPIYKEEIKFVKKYGWEKLYEKFREYKINDWVDINRPNTVK